MGKPFSHIHAVAKVVNAVNCAAGVAWVWPRNCRRNWQRAKASQNIVHVMWDDLARLDVSHGFERQGIATVYADGRNSFDPPGYREHLTLNVPCTANTAWQVGACSQETDP